MKKIIEFIKKNDVWVLLALIAITLVIAYLSADASCALAAVIPSASVGKIVSGEPLTRSLSVRHSDGLIKNAIDERITKIRPMSTPIDQLSRWAGARKADSMVVDYYSVDIKPTKATLSVAYTEPSSSAVTTAAQKVTITTSNNDIFEVSETLLVQGLKAIEWSESFNLNDYKTQGIYYISGERLLSEYDNLPIMNAASGHTISGQLTVLDASLSDAEMCVTQYLKLTNRTGSEGKEYIRTYNKYSNGNEGWSVWKEIKQTANLNQISDEELKNYTENGYYEGVVNNGENPSPEQIARDISDFFATLERGNSAVLPTTAFFTMEVLNNYAVTQKMSQILGEEVPNTFVQRVKCVFPTLEYVEVYRIGNSISGFGAWTKINK